MSTVINAAQACMRSYDSRVLHAAIAFRNATVLDQMRFGKFARKAV
jgi:hypothetical protein